MIRSWQSFAPASGLPAISPTRGEISLSVTLRWQSRAQDEGWRSATTLISPLGGRWPAAPEGGNVGALSRGGG